jgi:hypothetical protein
MWHKEHVLVLTRWLAYVVISKAVLEITRTYQHTSADVAISSEETVKQVSVSVKAAKNIHIVAF